MTAKKSILAILVGFIISNVLTTLWYMITDEANMVPYRREDPLYGGLILNHLIYVGLLWSIFVPYFQQNSKLKRAIVFGLIGSAIMFIPQALVVRSIWQVEFNLIFLLNTFAHLAIGGLIGLGFGIIYNYKRS